MSETFNLIDRLKAIPDYRKSKGKRHELWLLLALVLLGSLCGYRGYRPLEDFSKEHWGNFRELLDLSEKTRIPPIQHFAVFCSK